MKTLLSAILYISISLLLSLFFWSTGWIELRVGKGQLDSANFPGWMRSLYGGTIARASAADWSSAGAYLNIAMGTAILGVVVVAGVVSWYRRGFDVTNVIEGMALLLWLAIINWYWKLGR
jgi:hypothetical protein